MTKDEIEKLAVEAGWPLFAIQMLSGTEDEKRLQRFAELVAEDARKRIANERRPVIGGPCNSFAACNRHGCLGRCISAIRARGNA